MKLKSVILCGFLTISVSQVYAYKLIKETIKSSGGMAFMIQPANPKDIPKLYQQKKNYQPMSEVAYAKTYDTSGKWMQSANLTSNNGVRLHNFGGDGARYESRYFLECDYANIEIDRQFELKAGEDHVDDTQLNLTFQPKDWKLYTIIARTYVMGEYQIESDDAAHFTVTQ